MKGNRLLAVVSAAQLASGLGGMALGIRRRHAFDIPFWQGQQSTVGRDSVLMGTALSAPVVMLTAQAWATAALFRRPDTAAERTLGALGAAMVAGYLAERLVRQRLAPPGWDAAETPVAAAGICLAAAMALIGLRPQHPGKDRLGRTDTAGRTLPSARTARSAAEPDVHCAIGRA